MNYLTFLQITKEDLTKTDKKHLTNFSIKLNGLIKEKRFEESIDLAKATLSQIHPLESDCIRMCYQHELVKQINSYIVYLFNQKEPVIIKRLFQECEEYIYNNIFSFLITMTNYSTFLLHTNHAKISKSLIEKVRNIHVSNYLTKHTMGTIEETSQVYSNMSYINKANKNNEEGIVNSMEALVLNQIDLILNNKATDQLFLVYYNLGTQQEDIKRTNDAKASFYRSKYYLQLIKEIDKGKKEDCYSFIDKIKISDNDNLFNFNDSFNNKELINLKTKTIQEEEKRQKRVNRPSLSSEDNQLKKIYKTYSQLNFKIK